MREAVTAFHRVEISPVASREGSSMLLSTGFREAATR
jgi:hypothetical protein